MRERRRVCHVDADSVAMAQRRVRDQLVQGRPGVTKGDDAVEADLVKVGGFELEHLKNAGAADCVGSLAEVGGCGVGTAEARANEVFTIAIEKLERAQVGACGYLDELGKAVADLADGQSAQEAKVEEGVDGGVVGTQAVLVVAIIDCDLDGDGSVNEADDGCRDADEVCVTTVGGTGKSSGKG